jgi:5-methyltetrahydropteroyltriglutamate--homocysteine methyltransferase
MTVDIVADSKTGNRAFKQGSKPPFRADHVGSLLRPKELSAARAAAKRGEIPAAELRSIEDQAVKAVVALQEGAGLKSITDGEFRRDAWHTDFLTGLDGVGMTGADYAISFRDDKGAEEKIGTMLSVTGKIRRIRPIMVDHFAFLHSVTKETAKFSIPSPTYLHMRAGKKIVSGGAYYDLDEFWSDVVAAYRAEIADLAAAGCKYLQLDDVSISFLCDPAIREQVRKDGEDPKALPGKYAEVINAIIADRPADLAVTVHTCRGNHHSLWMAKGGYEAVAEQVFSTLDADGLFLEFDTERAGGFEPLRYIPKDKRIVLGLISSKLPELEDSDDLKRKIDRAAKFVPIEDLCIGPQCGFASTAVGNQITEDIERRKLELAVAVATDVWGTF